MGFLDKMKAANGLNFGDVESPDFPCCSLIMKQGKLCIIDRSMNGHVQDCYIEQKNVEEFRLIGCGGSWAKYYIRFKNGKSAIITQPVLTQAERQAQKISMAPLERFLKITIPSNGPNVSHNTQQPETILSVKTTNQTLEENNVGAKEVDKQKGETAKDNNQFETNIQEEIDNKTIVKQYNLDDKICFKETVVVGNIQVNKGDTGVIDNRMYTSGGRIYIVILDKNKKKLNVPIFLVRV